MSNVVSVKNEPEQKRCIKDMVKGEIGYAVTWAYRNGELYEEHSIHKEKRGTASLLVKCVKPHKYALEFEREK